ncbi:MAG TPA: class I SAM-dependent methyltransferase [Acidimicrobiales bacterium]|nr:class I SAM-dependent methyltransferase [Acidimicrobiales bacterium]
MLTVDFARLGLRAGDRLLDLGCGGGRHAFEAHRRGASVVALDRSPAETAACAGLLAAMRASGEAPASALGTAVIGDGLDLPFPDGAFDRVVAAEVLEHVVDDAAAMAELARVLRPGGTLAVTVPRWFPERVCWALAADYHAPAVPGGHVRIYRRAQLGAGLRGTGLQMTGSHHAHALHSPYWWLRCLVGVDRDEVAAVRLYHRLLVWDITRRPRLLRLLERALNPVLGKSLVLYFEKPHVLVALSDDGRRKARQEGRGGAALTPAEVAATVDSIAAVQLGDGMIPWFPGGHADPWNHVEAAMALTAGGRRAEAEAAYAWLVRTQRPDGAWHQYYLAGARVNVATLDANVTAYVATGVWHHFLATRDTGFLEAMWPVVERAMGFVLGLQTASGEVIWARHADGTPWPFALLTASSSTLFSLRCALAAATRLGGHRPDWELAAASLAAAVARPRPGAFLPKDRWSMDWYYPVLAGVVNGDGARTRLAEGRSRFVMEGLGTRCVSDRPWVTAAETAECALAHVAAGLDDPARLLLSWTRHLRHEDGSYFTGMVHPERVHFPGGERTTYGGAAVVLATDALSGTGPASGLFRGTSLPPVVVPHGQVAAPDPV